MLNLNHKNLTVWKESIEFIANIYQLTLLFPKEELYGLVSQLRRAAVSIASNLAEGAARSTLKERKRFYEIARSSLVEIDTQLEIAYKLQYCDEKNLESLKNRMNHIFAMLSNMISKK